MKRYKLTLIPEGKTFDSLFESKEEATTFVCQYIDNHPRAGLTPFDFSLEEYDELPTDITSYDKAISSLGGLECVTISVDVENREKLSLLDSLMTIARAWNKVDGTIDTLPHPGNDRHFPQFNYYVDADRQTLNRTHPMVSNGIFGIDGIISFRTKELANAFSYRFKDIFAKLFNVPFES